MNRSLTVNALCATINASRASGSSGVSEIDLPAGRWRIGASHGMEHVPVAEEFEVSGQGELEKTLRFERAAQEATYLDYLHEVEHAAERVARLERAIDQAIEVLPAEMRALIAGLQALRGIKQVSAATIVAEVGPLSRFPRPKQLMGYSGMVSSEDSTGDRVRRGAITKTGNAHLRRIVGEAAWAYQYRPAMSPELKKRQEGLSEEVKEIAWKAQHRLSSRFRRLTAKGKLRQKVTVAIGRELLGFIWAIGIQVEKEQRLRQARAQAA